MSAPPVECCVVLVVEGGVSLVVSGPMSAEGIVTGHVDLAVSVDVGILGVGTGMSAPSSGMLLGVVWVPGTTIAEHGPMVSSLLDVTEHLSLVVTVEVSESSPGSCASAPSLDVGGVDGGTEASVSVGGSMPVSAQVIRAGLVGSAISGEVGVLGVGTSMSAPSGSELVCSGPLSGDEVVVEFFFLLDFVGGSDGGDQSELGEHCFFFY